MVKKRQELYDKDLVEQAQRVKAAEAAAKRAAADFEGLGDQLMVLGENLGVLAELVAAQRALIAVLIGRGDK